MTNRKCYGGKYTDKEIRYMIHVWLIAENQENDDDPDNNGNYIGFSEDCWYSVIENYMPDSPGPDGDILVVVWGSPTINDLFFIEDGKLKKIHSVGCTCNECGAPTSSKLSVELTANEEAEWARVLLSGLEQNPEPMDPHDFYCYMNESSDEELIGEHCNKLITQVIRRLEAQRRVEAVANGAWKLVGNRLEEVNPDSPAQRGR